jgi:nitrate reductase alpha subunit
MPMDMIAATRFVRAGWDEVTEIIAAANAYTIKKYGPDRVGAGHERRGDMAAFAADGSVVPARA